MPAAAVPTIAYPPELPVSARREELLAAIGDHQVVIVAGETGSGKTTQLPKLCLELGRTRIAHTQPRRLAARTVAERIAQELNVPLGEAVGYAVRFSDRSQRDTRIRLMTDGLLLAEIQRDRSLRRYDTIIVDEAHERSLNIDFLLGCIARILPQRPELKLIVTSATIDPERFSRFFDDAPIVAVSGRTYPVELRYRPIDDLENDPDRDQVEAIGDAVEELLHERGDDVLVFLSGEREIRDTAEALRARLPDSVELLPLYARLSSPEQQRVFEPHGARRVVLATNVAETSLTVPGIRSVVDPGNARISRYSARLKVQRLPIERISRASADQRAGRCGRTAPGICIRLYGEDDYDERPRFTDPEILRTSLAAVILQMAALGLGDIEAFPFLDPPDRRQIRDGILLLQELGALDSERALTGLGRRLARLPVDPRLGRMVLEADRLGCADEVIVIAAALSIQDPRERPTDKRQQADQAHARFVDPDEPSDFLAYLSLWRYLRTQRRELSGNQLRKRCRAEYLHYLRVREWQDLAAQLRRAARDLRITIDREPAQAREIHQALLAGLLSHVGMRDERRRGEYQGARNARFAIFPGSALARRAPRWVMAAELVETSRLWARAVAPIDPAWIEPLAPHLVRRSYSEPRWQRERASVVATERVVLYGLPIVADRTVAYGRIDPPLARELFIRRALVEGDWDTRHDFFHDNAKRIEQVEALEHRTRRRDLLVADEAIHRFYDERIPADVVSGAHFDRWWRDAHRARPDLLTLTREHLLDPDAAAAIDPGAWPTHWRAGELVLRLSYHFEPGSQHDGVTVHVPLTALGRLKPDGLEWLVPGLRRELITALVRGLPKPLRRPLVPVPELVEALMERLTPRREPLLDALARELEALRGVRVPHGAWTLGDLPAHLRMRFEVEGTGEADTDLDALRERLRPRLRAELTAAAPELERSDLRAWTIGTLPRAIDLPGSNGGIRGYPALVDDGEAVAVRVLDTPAEQEAAMRAGTRRLLALTVPSPARYAADRLDGAAKLALARHGSIRATVEDAVAVAIDALVAEAGGPAYDEGAFERLRDHVAGSLADRTLAVLQAVARILDAERAVRALLQERGGGPFQPAHDDVAAQLRRLVAPAFVARAGAARLPDLERYLRAAERRLARLPDQLGADTQRMRLVQELERAYEACGERPPELRWQLEELRVSQFAQALGTRGTVSVKRIRKALAAA